MPREQERRSGREVPQEEEPVFEVIGSGEEDDGWLCPDAERFLYDDIQSGEVSLVNDTFLMKSSGARVGVAVEERFADGGDITPGVWYQIADREARTEVAHRMFGKGGERSITLPGKTVWREERIMSDHVWGIKDTSVTRKELLDIAKQAAEAIRKSQKRS